MRRSHSAVLCQLSYDPQKQFRFSIFDFEIAELLVDVPADPPIFNLKSKIQNVLRRLRLHRLITALRALSSALQTLFRSTSTRPLTVAGYAVVIAVFKGLAIDLSFMCCLCAFIHVDPRGPFTGANPLRKIRHKPTFALRAKSDSIDFRLEY
jgi:hypothetical protein